MYSRKMGLIEIRDSSVNNIGTVRYDNYYRRKRKPILSGAVVQFFSPVADTVTTGPYAAYLHWSFNILSKFCPNI